MGAGKKLAVLVRVPVDRVVEKIRAHAAVVQQRVALARGRHSRERPAATFDRDEDVEQLALGLMDLSGKGRVAVESVEPRRHFLLAERRDPQARSAAPSLAACRA